MSGSGISSRGDGQSGVTLIEVLVALAIVALTLAVAATGLRLLARSGDRGAHLIAEHDALARGIDVLRRDIERLERIVSKRGENYEFVFRGDATGLTLVAIEPPFPSEAGPYFVVYAIQQRRDGAALVRARAPFRRAAVQDLGRLSTADPVAVIEGPYRLRLMYLDRTQERERWVAQWSDPSRLPDLIGLEVSGLTDGGGSMSPIVFRPRIDAERGCVKDGGGSCTTGTRGMLTSESAAGQGGGN